jgi:hypothetical protein
MFLADLTNRPEIMMANPDWQIVFDFDGDAAAATRRRVLDMVATDRIRVTGYHYPFPANGYVARAGNGFRFVARGLVERGVTLSLESGRDGTMSCVPASGREDIA